MVDEGDTPRFTQRPLHEILPADGQCASTDQVLHLRWTKVSFITFLPVCLCLYSSNSLYQSWMQWTQGMPSCPRVDDDKVYFFCLYAICSHANFGFRAHLNIYDCED